LIHHLLYIYVHQASNVPEQCPHLQTRWKAYSIVIGRSSVAEPEPQGDKTFRRSRNEVSARALAPTLVPGQTKLVY
jgi:hypothetical protein